MNGFAKPSVLVVCQTNHCLSQMAEGFLNAFAGDLLDVHSAGFKPPASVHQAAIRVMAEVGIDISQQKTRNINQYLGCNLDTVIVLSSSLNSASLEMLNATSFHDWFFDDPSSVAATEDQRLSFFRRVRDDIRRVCEAYANGRADAETANLIRWPSPFTPV